MDKTKAVLATISLFLIAPTVQAQNVIDATDRGWYSGNGQHISTNQNTITGPGFEADTNSWFLFDLSQVQPQVCSATLRLEMETWNSGSPDGESTIWDVETNTTTLVQSHVVNDAEGILINTDLESGTNYASKTVYATDVGSVIEFSLSTDAVDDINAAAGGMFAVGTHLTAVDQSTFLRWSWDVEERTHQLVLNLGPDCGFGSAPTKPVPFPLSTWLFMAILMLAAGIRTLVRN